MHERPRKGMPRPINPDAWKEEQDASHLEGLDRSFVKVRKYEYKPYVKYVPPPRVFGAYEPERVTDDTWRLTKTGDRFAGITPFIVGRALVQGYVEVARVVEDTTETVVYRGPKGTELVVCTLTPAHGEKSWVIEHRVQ